MNIAASKPTGNLPRVVSPNLLWLGGCLPVEYRGQTVFGHFSIYLVMGSEKTMLVDTGHPGHWPEVSKALRAALGDRKLDYIFPTHAELPHAGLLPKLMEVYPDALCVGDMRDWHLYYPELVDRMRHANVGDYVSLGDRNVCFVPAVWRDIPNTLWAFEDTDRVLFVSDSFAYLHYHHPGESDYFTSEMPLPEVGMIQFFNERALQWTRFTDVQTTFGDADFLMETLKPRIIAPAHGGIIDNPEIITPHMKVGMTVEQVAPPAAS